MTAPTCAPGAPWSPALDSVPRLKPMRSFIRRVKSALITLAHHRTWSTGAQARLFRETRQLARWQPLEIRVPTEPSRTQSRRPTAETCSWNIHSTLPSTNLLLLRCWNQTRVHTCQTIATTEPHSGGPLRTAVTQPRSSRSRTMDGETPDTNS